MSSDLRFSTSLRGRVAIVTGGGRGIGRAAALDLARRGAQICVTARSADEIDDAAREIAANGGVAIAHQADLTDYDACRGLAERVSSEFDAPPYILVNNAGGGDTAALLVRSDPKAWWETVQVNLMSGYYVTRAFLPAMVEARAGQIIMVGSGAGYAASRGTSAYGSAKAALAHMTRTLADEVWKYDIAVNEVVPGPVATRLTKGLFALGEAPPVAPSERVKSPEEVAELIGWLATRPVGGPTGQMFSLARRSLR